MFTRGMNKVAILLREFTLKTMMVMLTDRWIRIPIQITFLLLKRNEEPYKHPKKISEEYLSSFILKTMNLIQTHKRLISWYQKKLGLSDYGLLWFVFFKGVGLTLLIQWLFY